MSQTVEWLRSLAAKGGKGIVDNIDARSLGRIADELERLRELEGPLERWLNFQSAHNSNNLYNAAMKHFGRTPALPD